jgi:hypothetical protein
LTRPSTAIGAAIGTTRLGKWCSSWRSTISVGGSTMTDEVTPDERPRLIPADPDELRKAISFALLFNGRKRNHHADSLAADINADHLAQALEKGNFIVMRKSTPTHPATWPPAPRNLHLTD